MKHHEHMILQKWIRARTIGDAWRADDERVRGAERQQEEIRQHRQHHGNRPTDEWFVDTPTHPPCRSGEIARQDEHPHQNRAFEGAPYRRKVVQRRRAARANLLHVIEREVAAHHRPLHHAECTDCRGHCDANETRHEPQRLLISTLGTDRCCESAEERRHETQ